jgi:hypothetical protein
MSRSDLFGGRERAEKDLLSPIYSIAASDSKGNCAVCAGAPTLAWSSMALSVRLSLRFSLKMSTFVPRDSTLRAEKCWLVSSPALSEVVHANSYLPHLSQKPST